MSNPVSARRFVVLRHEGVDQPHFDLMVEAGDSLMTWRSEAWPVNERTELKQLRPHRRAYLDYQGPVSVGRGEVIRVDEGVCDVEERPDEFRLGIAGGAIVLLRMNGDAWIASPLRD